MNISKTIDWERRFNGCRWQYPKGFCQCQCFGRKRHGRGDCKIWL
jgi:hypothetical protein